MALNGVGAGTPDNWDAFLQKVNQVEKVDLQKITDAATQFRDAGKNAGDHNASLKTSTDSLDAHVWAGPAADQFFTYVRQVRDAGTKVQTHLEDVAKDLDDLQQNLAQIKKTVQDKQLAAEKDVNARNTTAESAMNKALADAKTAVDNGKPAPSPSAAEILATAKTDIHTITAGYDGDVAGLQTQADTAIKASQTLMSQQIEGGYDQVPLPASSAAAPKSTGGIHSNGASHGGGGGSGGGGGGGGGGGLGPSGGPPASPPPGNVQQWIQEAIKALQAAGVPVTDADIPNIWAIIQHESGGNPNAINNWDCVPLDTLILTKRGVLKHDAVEVGDETIGFDPATGRGKWTRITRVVHHEDAELVRMSNSRWSATTTPNHRWLNLPRVNVRRSDLPVICPECGWAPRAAHQPENGVAVHRRKKHGFVSPKQENRYENEPGFVATQDVGSRDRILLTAPAATESTLEISVPEAAVLGWIAGDGHVETRQHRPTMSIAQSKPEMVAKIRRLLDGVPHAVYVDDRGGCGPRHQFRLDHDYAQDLLRRAGNPKSDAVAQVLAMSSGQRAAWLEAVIDAEEAGTRGPAIRDLRWSSTRRPVPFSTPSRWPVTCPDRGLAFSRSNGRTSRKRGAGSSPCT